MRFMPVEGVCYAGLEDISKLGQKVLPEHFPTGDTVPQTTVSTFCLCLVTCVVTNNSNFRFTIRLSKTQTGF